MVLSVTRIKCSTALLQLPPCRKWAAPSLHQIALKPLGMLLKIWQHSWSLLWTRAGRSHLDVKCVVKRWIVHSKVFFWGGGIREGGREGFACTQLCSRARAHTHPGHMHALTQKPSLPHPHTNKHTYMHAPTQAYMRLHRNTPALTNATSAS